MTGLAVFPRPNVNFSVWTRLLVVGIALVVSVPGASATSRHFSGTIPNDDQDPGVRLLRTVVERFAPQEATLVLDALPDGANTIRHLYLDLIGASSRGFRIARIQLEPAFTTFNPTAAWDTAEGLRVEQIVSAKFDAIIAETDLNAFLKDRAFGKGEDRWQNASVRLGNNAIVAKARYLSGMIRALVELRTALEVRDGNQIWFSDFTFSVNGDSQNEGLIRDALRKIQPVVDFRDFLFPVKIHTLRIEDATIRMQTRTPPALFDGLTYTYTAP